MAVHPLRPATDRRLGEPLPRQLANQTRVHLIPPEFFALQHALLCAYAVLAVISNCYPPVWGRLPTRYSPVRHSVTKLFIPKESKLGASFDLHVLGTPPAFILSQDQTLMLKFFLVQNNTWLFFPFYCFRFVSIFPKLHYFLNKEFSGFGSLFSYHCSLLFFWFVLSATTSIFYHFHGSLSTTFLFFSLNLFFKLFLRSSRSQHWKPL